MAEKVFVPIGGTNVINQISESEPAPQADAVQPAREPVQPRTLDDRAASLSKTRNERTLSFRVNGLGQQMRRNMERQAQPETPAPAPQPSPEMSAMREQISALTGAVNTLAQRQPSNMSQPVGAPERGGTLEQLMLHNQHGSGFYDGDSQQYGGGSQDYGGAPDPNDFDLWDDVGRAQYRHALDSHVKEIAQRAVESDRTSRQQAAAVGEIDRQCRDVREKYGRDANYDEVANAAKVIHLNAGGELTVEQAYLQASREIEARSGQRRSGYMPKEITGIKGLGRMWQYNEATGRASQRRGR